MAIKNINDLQIPDEYSNTHFGHRVRDDWYLIPNTAASGHDHNEEFECWLFNTNGSLATAVSYQMKRSDLGF